VQITLGREYSRQEVLALSEHYKQWTSGFLAWPWWVLHAAVCRAPTCLALGQYAVTADDVQ